MGDDGGNFLLVHTVFLGVLQVIFQRVVCSDTVSILFQENFSPF